MDRTLREDGRGSRGEVDLDEASTVLGKEACAEGGVQGEVDLGGTRVGVGSVHAAGTEETDGHRDTVTDESGEVRRGGSDGVSGFSGGDTRRGVEEVKGVLK